MGQRVAATYIRDVISDGGGSACRALSGLEESKISLGLVHRLG
jgi:hypothetical protein